MTTTNYNYRIATELDLNELSELFVKIFNHREKMTMAANTQDSEMLFFAKTLFPQLIKNELIWLAEDLSENKIIGFTVATTIELLDQFNVMAAEFINSMADSQIKQRFAERTQFNELLSAPIKQIANIENENVLKGLYAGVEKGYSTDKIYLFLIQFVMKNMQERGYTACIFDATNPTSQHIAVAQGAVEFNRIKYSESGIEQYANVDGDIVSYILHL